MESSNVFSKIISSLSKNDLFMVYGFWCLFGVYQYQFMYFPVLFSPPLFQKFNQESREFEAVSLIYACGNLNEVTIDPSSRDNFAKRFELYCDRRYIADTISGVSMLGSLISLLICTFWTTPPQYKLLFIKILSLLWALSLVVLIYADSLSVIFVCLFLANFLYGFQLTEALAFNNLFAPNGFSKTLLSSYWIMFTFGSVFSLSVAFVFHSSWKVFYSLNVLYFIASLVFHHKRNFESDKNEISLENKNSETLILSLENELTFRDYFINFFILFSANIIYYCNIVAVNIELGDSSEPLFLYLVLSILNETIGSYIGAGIIMKYDSKAAYKYGFIVLSMSSLPFLFYSDENRSIFKYIGLFGVLTGNIFGNIINTSFPEYFPKKLYSRIYSGSCVMLRFGLILTPILFSYFKFTLHIHLIGIIGIVTFGFIKIIPALKIDHRDHDKIENRGSVMSIA